MVVSLDFIHNIMHDLIYTLKEHSDEWIKLHTAPIWTLGKSSSIYVYSNSVFCPKHQTLMKHLICGEHYTKFIMLIYFLSLTPQARVPHYLDGRFYVGKTKTNKEKIAKNGRQLVKLSFLFYFLYIMSKT